MGSISINPVATPSFTITTEVTGDERLTASAPGRGKTIVTVDLIIDKVSEVLGTGSGGQSSSYPIVSTTDSTVYLRPNTYTKINNNDTINLHLLLISLNEMNTSEYIIEGIFSLINFNFTVLWAHDNPPTFDGTTRHIISICEGVGTWISVPTETEE